MILALLLSAMLNLIPAPVDYTVSQGFCTNEKVTVQRGGSTFKRETASLEDFQKKEAYRITVASGGIKIETLTKEGEFRARTTLKQLKECSEALPCCIIFDYPRFRHRGLMLDESRSFKGVDFIKKQIDAMSELKLNVLHLHLVSIGLREEDDGSGI